MKLALSGCGDKLRDIHHLQDEKLSRGYIDTISRQDETRTGINSLFRWLNVTTRLHTGIQHGRVELIFRGRGCFFRPQN